MMELKNNTPKSIKNILQPLAGCIKQIIRWVSFFLLATIILFSLVQLLPGDAATQVAGKYGEASIQITREAMGLNSPVYRQYIDWLSGLLTFDLGETLATQMQVRTVLANPMKGTMMLAALVYLGLVFVTLPLSVMVGAKQNRPVARGASIISIILVSVPEFVTSIFLLVVLAQKLKWLPVLSNAPAGVMIHQYPIAFVMPALCLWLICSAGIFRRVSALIATYANTAYVREATLAGLPKRRVLFYHLLPSALPGIAQLYAHNIPYLLGGAVVVETITSFPGMGYLLVQSVAARETPMVMAIGALLIAVTLGAFALSDVFKRRAGRVKAVV